ncbi:AIPR family protein [Microcoleus sp. herbarium14]|uniref:AIPR family protein n=1 Tax=Microcoleus sp. herbarium14 TaxID=3055439 RepID=UPI002FD6C156
MSIGNIHQRILNKRATKIKLSVKAQDARGDKLLVGAVKLMELYHFMKAYRDQAGDLDRLYEKNVRRFLGDRRKVNKAIKETLEQHSKKTPPQE